VVEDAAQAHGASASGRRAGAYGHAAAFSFYPTKNLGAYGDAGAVTSNDARLVEHVRELRQGGHPAATSGEVAGRNSRLDELQAALLRVKLKHLEKWNRRRQALADAYRRELNCGVVTQEAGGGDSHVYHLFVIRHECRDHLREHLAARGVETFIHYPHLLHRRPLFRAGGGRPLPVAEGVVERIVSLPLYPHLRAEELRAVMEAANSFRT
jgi:dTDP-4-amino-4,6-dideoxygalactose transaminase